MKIIICDPLEAEAVERLREAGLEVDVRETIRAEELAQVIGQYEGMVVRSRTKVTATMLQGAGRLKVIVRGGVGLDNIDVEAADKRGITVLNTPGASTASVAELAIGYMLALARQIVPATLSMRAGKWEKKRFAGQELGGKTLGVVGIGRIGQETARLARAFGMRTIAFDPYVTQAEGVEMVSLDDLIARSDYLTLHLPHTPETHHLIDAAQIEKMKDGVRIINCARGGILDETALYAALQSGKVAGAALDVFEQEPPADFHLFELENVIGSPHIGAATEEGQARVGAEVAQRLIDFYQKS